jgi:hypothetical protein
LLHRVDEERRQLERQLVETDKKLGRWYAGLRT